MPHLIIAILLILLSSPCMMAQRSVSPVKAPSTVEQPDLNKKGMAPRSTIYTMVQNDSLAALDTIPVDTLKRKMIYPLMNSIIVGANIWDPVMRAFGQTYGGGDISVEMSLWNRLFPTLEMGIGMANTTPEEGNFTYKCNAALYGKIGASYNFLYNSTPDYQFLTGFRFGYSSFKYDITNVTVNSGYWGETGNFEILNQKSHASWAELVFALRVKIIDNLSMGWSFRYRFVMSYKKNENSDPWYIPGLGDRNQSTGGTFSIYYTLPLKQKNIVKPLTTN